MAFFPLLSLPLGEQRTRAREYGTTLFCERPANSAGTVTGQQKRAALLKTAKASVKEERGRKKESEIEGERKEERQRDMLNGEEEQQMGWRDDQKWEGIHHCLRNLANTIIQSRWAPFPGFVERESTPRSRVPRVFRMSRRLTSSPSLS